MEDDDNGWTPDKEKENDPDKLQREMLDFGKQMLEKMKKQEAGAVFVQPQSSPPAVLGALPLIGEITFRAIENGFILAWEEWQGSHGYLIPFGRRREVHVKDADDALPHLKTAMDALRKAMDIPPPM